MAIQKLNTARGTRHVQIKDDGRNVFISKDRYDELKRSGETVKRARTTDSAASGSKSGGSKSGGSKSGGSKSGGSKSGGRKSGGRKSGSSPRESGGDDFFKQLFANMR